MDTSPSTVFLITHEFFPKRGGIATFAEEIARASADLGYEVEVWAQANRQEYEKTWPFRMRRLPLRGTHDLLCQARLAWQLIRERRRLRYATVYLPEPGPMLAMMLLQFFRAFRPKHLVLTFHGSEILRFYENPVTRWLTRRLIGHANRISTLTHYTHRLLCTHFPEAADKAILTPGALRSDFAVVNSVPPFNSAKKTVVLTVGRLHPRKGQRDTLEALIRLPEATRRGIEYWIVGSGKKTDYEIELRELAASATFPVRFFGDLPDNELDAIYDRADIFAMTSVRHGLSVEGFGLVYLEAAAHALPIVAHTIGGVAEAVADNETGFLVPPGRPDELTQAFARLIADPELRGRLGRAGRRWARRNSWERSARVLFEAVDVAADD